MTSKIERPNWEIERIVNDTIDAALPQMTDATREQLFETIVSLAAFAPHQTFTIEEYDQFGLKSYSLLRSMGLDRIADAFEQYRAAHPRQTILIVGDSDKIAAASFDFKAFMGVCCYSMIPDDAATLYKIFKNTPLLYRIDEVDLETGERKDSGRVTVRKEIRDELETLFDDEE